MLAKSKNIVIKYNSFKILVRLRHKLNKQNEEKQGPKVAPDVMNYLESSNEYKDILNTIPKTLLRKYKTPETMYLINKNTAKDMSDMLRHHMKEDAPIVEVNPGFTFLTQELLKCLKSPVHLYESSNNFTQQLNDIQHQYPERVTYKIADFFGMWKLAFQDKMDNGNRITELLGKLATNDNNRILNIVGAMPSLSFVRHLINTIVFHSTTNQLGRPDLYIVMPGYHYEFLTDNSNVNKHKSVPALFQLLFDYKLLGKVPNVHFLPWTYPPNTKRTQMMDEYCLYLVNITQKETLPCTPNNLPLLWYFFKPQMFSKSTRVIPMLEQWIPGCGLWLITGQDPPDTNMDVSSAKENAPLPHMTIFTEFGDLSLQQKVTVFKRFISWPEFEQCPFRATMENNLPKFASQIGEEDKENIDVSIDDIESSDTEIDPENV